MMAKGIALLGAICAVFLLPAKTSAALISDLVITEIMANPASISDSKGEWFELYNPTGTTINLRDSILGDDGSDRHVIETDLLILPGRFLTLARSDSPGFVPDYVYRNFTLGNGNDEISILDLSGGGIYFDYSSGFVAAGISNALSDLSDPTSPFVLSSQTTGFYSGDVGTPGSFEGSVITPAPVPTPTILSLFLFSLLLLTLFQVKKQSEFLPRGDRGSKPKLLPVLGR